MINCFFCDNNADYILYSKKAFVCDKCLNDRDKKLANKLEYHTISNIVDFNDLNHAEINEENIPYFKENNILSTFCGFEILTPSIFNYIYKIKEIHIENSVRIIFFPNKEKSNEFIKKYMKVNLIDSHRSRYTFFYSQDSYYALINYEGTKVEDLEFILNLFDSQIILINNNFFNNSDFAKRIILLYDTILSIYVKKLGFPFRNFSEDDEFFSLQLSKDFIRLRDVFFSLKNMSIDNPNEIDEYIYKKISVFLKENMAELSSGNPTKNKLFDSIFLFSEYGILSSLYNNPSKLFYLIDPKIEVIDWWGNSEIFSCFKEYRNKLNKRFTSCNSENEFIEILNEEIIDLTNKIPPIFARSPEILALGNNVKELIPKINSLGKYYLYDQKIALNTTLILAIFKNIIENCKYFNPTMTYFGYFLREWLREELIYVDPDVNNYLEIYNETIELIEYSTKNLVIINNILHEMSGNKLDINNELAQMYDNLINLSYFMEDFVRLEELKKIINNEYINNESVNLSLRLYLLSKNFINQEDYSILNTIYRYGISFTSTKEDYSSIFKIFAEAFFEDKDHNKKNNLYEKVLDLINKSEYVSILNLPRSFKNNEFLYNLINIYFQIEKALQMEDLNSIIKQINLACDYAKSLGINIFKQHHISYYYYYKTMILYEIITTKDIQKIYEYLDFIKLFRFEQSIKFQEYIYAILESRNNDLDSKISCLFNLKKSDDLWIKSLNHFIKKDIEYKFYEDFSSFGHYREKLNLSSNKSFTNIVFNTIHDFAYYCRQHSQTFTNLNENSIRDLYLVIIKNIFSYAEGEAYNFDGKTDYKIINPSDKYEYIIGELKWWNCENDVKEVFNQIIRKHSTGQEKEVYMIILNKNKDINSVREKVINVLAKENELININTRNMSPKSSRECFMKFVVNIKGEEVPLNLGFINLYHERF